MPLKTAGIEEPTLNLTPMIDIVFLLIIFFMVGSQFTDEERRVEIRLPSTSETIALTALPDPITVGISSSGSVSLDGEAIDSETLAQRLAAARENYPGQAVVLRGDGEVPYQSVIDVLGASKSAGIENISLALKIRPPDSESR
ncbi:ExbD/TolR family protein [Stratiformator vulcanicus]|uniref:Biopolymer transport protein ExbD n=1 Tax=Stratiformator vulcanicus TaxID=2527980 RepID=A0A517QYJ1_9PLAN|nr:biopolymer transporter ExbD [Stratiformator vulcanicus]QDT36711.1 Biopolymer transport protein ExbD [Stratiformator vulcanicus]